MKRNKAKTLKNKLDKLWSLYIRDRFPKCIVCGDSPTQAHHCISRKAQGNGVKWHPRNGVGLCYRCQIHKLHGQQGDKLFLDTYIKRVNELVCDEEQEEIRQLSKKIIKLDISDLEELIEEFKWRLK